MALTAASRMVWSRMFIVFFDLMAPAHSCEEHFGANVAVRVD